MAFHVLGLDVLDTLPHVVEPGVGQFFAQEIGVVRRDDVQSSHAIAQGK